VGESWKDPARTFDVNAVGTLHLLEAARRVEPAPRVLLIGSAEVYGPVRPEDLPLTEDQKLNPVTPYAVSKVAAEYLGVQYHAGFGVPVVRARSFNHVGPHQAGSFVVADIAGRIAGAVKNNDREPIRVGNLSARRDYTDVRDVVRAYRLLVTEGAAGEAYNVCSGVDVSVDTLAHRLLALAEIDLRIEQDPALMRPVDVPVLVGDNTRLRAATGWRPEISLDETLRDVLAALLA
jgi:GDP-4-dehydro-6-deoxy-D-mannose reductase